MNNKILVLESILGNYSAAVEGLGVLTNNCADFFKVPTDFILVLFTGGADVDPSFYNDDSPLNMCRSILSRDNSEKTIFQHALTNNIPMMGICRGFQFLNVMAKGRMMHHINGHAGSVHLFDSPILEEPIRVNSFHHQMSILPEESHIIGWSTNKLSTVYCGKHDQSEKWDGPEVEAAVFPKIGACGVQYHPEWMSPTSEGALFFYKMADKFINSPIDEFVQIYTKNNIKGNKNKSETKSIAVCTRSNNTTG